MSYAEQGRILLDNLSLNDAAAAASSSSSSSSSSSARSKGLAKRQLSEGTKQATEQLYDTKIQRVAFLGARKPGVVPRMWTTEEDEALQKAVNEHGEKNWRLIAEQIPGRNHLQCLQRWKKALRPGLVKGHWSKSEDEKLLGLINTYLEKGSIGNVNWAGIAQQIQGRNAKQCRERWFLNLDPSINRGPWTAEEDKRLLELAAQCGGRWSLIAKNMEGRTENSVKTRFHSLQRQEARNRGWSSEEDTTLMNATLIFGRDWAKIVKQLPGRSRGQLKKRFAILTQHRPDMVRKVQEVEDNIAHGKVKVPNPPPPPIQPIGAQFLKTNLEAQQQGQAPNRPPVASAFASANVTQQLAPPPQQQQHHQQPQYHHAPQAQHHWQQQAPQQHHQPQHHHQQQQQQQHPYYHEAPAPAPATTTTNSVQPKKGLYSRKGSSWMNSIVDNLDSGLPFSDGTEAKKSLNRSETSNLHILDKLLTENSSGAPGGMGGELHDFGAPPPPPSMGGEVPSAPAQGATKGLKQYNSSGWGSLAGDALFDVPAPSSANGVPPVMRTGSGKKLTSSGASNWGPPLSTQESSSDIRNFLNML